MTARERHCLVCDSATVTESETAVYVTVTERNIA
jgi:hypothetical protein